MSNSALILWRVKEMTGFTFACTGLHIVCVEKNGNTLHLSRKAKDSGLQCVFTFHFLFITDMFDKRGSSVQDCLILHSKRNKKRIKNVT